MTTRSKTSSSRVNKLMDASLVGPGIPPQKTPNAVNSTLTTTTPSSHDTQTATNNHTTPQNPNQLTPTNSSLPRPDQILEATNLRLQRKSKRPLPRDPLDKYTKGVTIAIHDTFPESTYEFVSQATINEWEALKGEKLLAIPFENDA